MIKWMKKKDQTQNFEKETVENTHKENEKK